MSTPSKQFPHYFRTLPSRVVDIYRFLLAFEVTDPCIQHAIKKLVAAGKRGAKNAEKDVQEAVVSCQRWQEMRQEEIE